MTKLAADTVAIHRLTVRAGQQRAAESVRDSLQSADWPQAGQDNWVFIRRLQVSGAARQLPLHLLEQTRQYLTQSNNPEQVMRFASLAELLAALLTDLLRGRAGLHWYWRRWAHWFELPVSRAISGIVSEHLTLLPAVCARLAQREKLAAVCLSLTDSDARQLAVELAGMSGFRLPSVLEIAEVLGSEIDNADRQTPLAASQQTWAEQLTPRPGLLAYWRPLLQELDVADGRYQLALLLIGQDLAPLLLQQQPARLQAVLSACFAAMLNAKKAQTSGEPKPKPVCAKEQIHPRQVKPPLQAQPLNQVHQARAQTDGEANPKLDADTERQIPAPLPQKPLAEHDGNYIRQSRQTPMAESLSLADSSFPAKALAQGSSPEPASADLEFAGFHTRQGGLLYLLNILNRPEMRCLMLEHAETLPSGWGWLYRLGQELQLQEDDALVDFIARQLGLDDSGELGRLPPLPAREQVLDLALRWYGKTGVWQPELLALTGQIHYSPSHIDLYAPMSAIRLPVRLAGLDINPGWLPWLGRVVGFHYD
ncbi:hypothetical protein CWO84_18220 [Methylomonas sp. Kb3]|uniref:hypothetical protein n=1 Tax=Methylomonas sp. Kb3 TaxID=1611544 RepID=UPI000C32AE5C|nr:hypothetical protein [Methylomonas sp. Kb3]PKD38982.1 hypothetical protein CWO84_18220 [Methylomonas sp. Kb3]